MKSPFFTKIKQHFFKVGLFYRFQQLVMKLQGRVQYLSGSLFRKPKLKFKDVLTLYYRWEKKFKKSPVIKFLIFFWRYTKSVFWLYYSDFVMLLLDYTVSEFEPTPLYVRFLQNQITPWDPEMEEEDSDLLIRWLYNLNDEEIINYIPILSYAYLPLLWFTYTYEFLYTYFSFVLIFFLYFITFIPGTTFILEFCTPYLVTPELVLFEILTDRVDTDILFRSLSFILLFHLYVHTFWTPEYWLRYFGYTFGGTHIYCIATEIKRDPEKYRDDIKEFYGQAFGLVFVLIIIGYFLPLIAFLMLSIYIIRINKKHYSFITNTAQDEAAEFVKQSQKDDAKHVWKEVVQPHLDERVEIEQLIKSIFPFYPRLFGMIKARLVQMLFGFAYFLQIFRKIIVWVYNKYKVYRNEMYPYSYKKMFQDTALKYIIKYRPDLLKSERALHYYITWSDSYIKLGLFMEKKKDQADAFFERWFTGDLLPLRTLIYDELLWLWHVITFHPFHNRDVQEEFEMEYEVTREKRRLYEDGIDEIDDFLIAEEDTFTNLFHFHHLVILYLILYWLSAIVFLFILCFGVDLFFVHAQEYAYYIFSSILDDIPQIYWDRYEFEWFDRKEFWRWTDKHFVLITDTLLYAEDFPTEASEMEQTPTQYADIIRYYLYRIKRFFINCYNTIYDWIKGFLKPYKKMTFKEIFISEWKAIKKFFTTLGKQILDYIESIIDEYR
jgi:hypothetical protein